MSNVKAFITDVNRDGFHEVAEAIRATGGKDAEDINYDNTASGLDADNVQAAIDEVAGDVSDLVTAVNGISGDVDDLETAVSGLSGDVSDLGTAVSGKVSKSGDTMSGNLIIQANGERYVECANTDKSTAVFIQSANDGSHGIFSNGYYDGSFHSEDKWLLVRAGNNKVYVNGSVVPYGGELALNIRESGWHNGIYIDIGNGTYGIFCPYDISVKGVPSVSILDINIVGSYYQNVRIVLTRPNGIILQSDDLPNNASYVGRLCSVYFG